MGPGAVLAHDEEALGLRVRAAGDFLTPGEFFGVHVGEVAGGGTFAAVVGAAVVTRKAHDGRTRFLRVAAEEHHLFGTVLRLDFGKILHDRLDRFVPGAAHPARILRALGVRALQRIEKAVRVVEALQRRNALGAERIVRMLLPVFNLDDVIAAGFELQTAHRHVVAAVADGIARPDLVAFLGRRENGGRRESERARGENTLEEVSSRERQRLGHGRLLSDWMDGWRA